MWILNNEDYREYQAYKATGLTPNDLQQIKAGLLPDNEDRAPLPYSDPAMEAVEAYEDAWDYPTPEQQKRFSGLLEDE